MHHPYVNALGEERKFDTFPALVIPVDNRTRGARLPRVPIHVPRWSTIVHPSLACALNFRVSPGFSFGQLLVVLIYSLIVLYASIFRSNPIKDSNRVAYIAVSQIPVVVAFANKSNLLSWVSGVGYEKVNCALLLGYSLLKPTQLNYIHRFSGRVVVIAVNVHVLGHRTPQAMLTNHVTMLTSFLADSLQVGPEWNPSSKTA